MMYCQTIRSVRGISRDDRAKIATCSLRTPTDRLIENYSIDICSLRLFHLSLQAMTAKSLSKFYTSFRLTLHVNECPSSSNIQSLTRWCCCVRGPIRQSSTILQHSKVRSLPLYWLYGCNKYEIDIETALFCTFLTFVFLLNLMSDKIII